MLLVDIAVNSDNPTFLYPVWVIFNTDIGNISQNRYNYLVYCTALSPTLRATKVHVESWQYTEVNVVELVSNSQQFIEELL